MVCRIWEKGNFLTANPADHVNCAGMHDLTVPAGLELVVFDLDYTLWDAGGTWCDCLSPPFSLASGKVVDRNGRWVRLYEDVLEIMDALDAVGVPMALASRTGEPEWARKLLELLGVSGRFEFEEIYPGAKPAHFERLAEDSGFSYSQMLFFDDEDRNIREVGALGVTCVEVRSGMSWKLLRRGLDALS